MLIVFDLDDTLIDTSKTITPFIIRRFAEFLLDKSLLQESPEVVFQNISEMNEQMGSLKKTVEKIIDRLQARHFLNDALSCISAPLPRDFTVPRTPRALEVIHILREKKFQVALVSAGKEAFQRNKLERAGLEPSLFCKISICEDFQKLTHYKALMNEFALLPSACLAVGDKIMTDLEPAYQLGWRTVHMRYGRGLLAKREEWVNHSISTLSEILEIV